GSLSLVNVVFVVSAETKAFVKRSITGPSPAARCRDRAIWNERTVDMADVLPSCSQIALSCEEELAPARSRRLLTASTSPTTETAFGANCWIATNRFFGSTGTGNS